jgi:N-acetylmuramoyl-L-alanine amidase
MKEKLMKLAEALEDIGTASSKANKEINNLMKLVTREKETFDYRPIVIIIGHTRHSGGANNANMNVNEFKYNTGIAARISEALSDFEREIIITSKTVGDSLLQETKTSAQLMDEVNDLNPLFVISLHCNAFNKKATGTEVLYALGDDPSAMIAQTLLDYLIDALELKDRGTKSKKREDRGGYLLYGIKSPCIISEPFFIDNDYDLGIALKNEDRIVKAYADAIKDIDAELS